MPTAVFLLDAISSYLNGYTSILQRRIFYDKLKNNGSSAMNVDGSSVPFEFEVVAESNKIKEISQVRFLIGGEKLNFTTNQGRNFSKEHSGGLVNGLEFYCQYGEDLVNIFLDPVKMLVDFYCYESEMEVDVKAYSNTSDFLKVNIDMVIPFRLLPGTNDRLVLKVQDDLSVLDSFEVIVVGSQEVV